MVIDQAGTPKPGDYAPLFEAEIVFTKDQLEKGEDSAKEAEADKKPEEPGKEAEAGKKPEEPAKEAEAGKKPEEPAKVAEKEKNLTAALHEERMRRKELAGELEKLKAEIADIKAGKKPAEEGEEGESQEFKVLSDEEYETLVDEDPVEAMKYMNRLRRHERDQVEKGKKDTETDDVIMRAGARMATSVPGLFDEDKKVATDLVAFCKDNGLSQDALAVISDPGTRIQLRDDKGRFKSSVPLGEAAAEFTEFVYKLRSTAGSVTKDSVKAEVKAELEKEYAEKHEAFKKEIIEKFKTNPSTAYRDLGDVPGSADSAHSGMLSESQMARMSKEEQRKYLGG